MAVGALNIILVAAAILLVVQIGLMKSAVLRNDQVLKQVYPGFNPQLVPQTRRDINYVKDQLAEACDLFDPPEESLRKDYDLSIYFVEELSKANRALKQKAQDKQLQFSELNFKEKVPSDREAYAMINQLLGLERVVDLGLDYGVNFKSVEPGVTENLDVLPGIRQQRSQLKIICPGSAVMDFITGINAVVPHISFDALVFVLKGSYFEADVNINHTICDRKVLDIIRPGDGLKEKTASPSKAMQEFISLEEDLSRILKINNPFTREGEKRQEAEASSQPAAEGEEEKKGQERFFYRGKAILRSKEVAVIEDAQNQETFFVSREEKVGDFILKDFSDEEAVLGAAAPGFEDLVLKRAEG
jgi:hypothetical protein